jgi:serine/threonine protein kinase
MKQPIMTGTLAGEYRVGPIVAFGRHARIFACEDQLGRRAHLKVLRPNVRDHGAFRELFAREQKILARLCHPNIERLRAHGSMNGEPYYVVDAVGGITAAELAGFEHWTMHAALELGGGILTALRHAHEQGVGHGALAEDLIRIDHSGRVVLTRFGLAPLRCETADRTERTVFDGGGSSPDRKDRRAADIFDVSQLMTQRLRPFRSQLPPTLKEVLRAGSDPSPISRPTAREMSEIFDQLLRVAPVLGIAMPGYTAWDVTERVERPRAAMRTESVTSEIQVGSGACGTRTQLTSKHAAPISPATRPRPVSIPPQSSSKKDRFSPAILRKLCSAAVGWVKFSSAPMRISGAKSP